MPDQPIDSVLEGTPFTYEVADPGFGGMFLNWIFPTGSSEPQWWSPIRDGWLRNYWMSIDALKTAVGTFSEKTLAIPFSIQPLNHGIQAHVALSKSLSSDLYRNSGTIAQGPMRGLRETLFAFTQDYLTQDNGAFMLVMGRGSTSQPILGRPLGLLHLDSANCQRTGDPRFPILYTQSTLASASTYKIHYTRVIDMAHLPSPISDMHGVGLCPISCCTMAAQEIRDMYRFSQERFGSRPPRQILYAKTGATISELTSAIRSWNLLLDQENRTHFGGTIIVAPKNASSTMELGLLDLSRAPDGFDRQQSMMQDKAEIAAAFGLDLLDLAMAFGIQGQTRANADVQTRKGRGKGPGAFIESIIEQLNNKYLPASLTAVADNVDDDQDQQRAQIMNERSQAYARQIQFGIRDVRSTRNDMLNAGEITQELFDELELADGRLPSGITVLALFYSEDATFSRWLDLGATTPTNVSENDASAILPAISSARAVILSEVQPNANRFMLQMGAQALSALDALEKLYSPASPAPTTTTKRLSG